MKLKSFIAGLVVGIVLASLYFLLSGCGGAEVEAPPDGGEVTQLPDSSPPEPDSLPTMGDPVKACYDFAALLGNKMFECTMDPDLSNKWQEDLEALLDCPTVTGVRDIDVLYEECFPALIVMSCDDLYNVEPPNSCMSQFIAG